jgi:tetratricopeptide (TPR) repeat protein
MISTHRPTESFDAAQGDSPFMENAPGVAAQVETASGDVAAVAPCEDEFDPDGRTSEAGSAPDTADFVQPTPRWARTIFAATAVAALASLSWAALSQLGIEGPGGRPPLAAALPDGPAGSPAGLIVEPSQETPPGVAGEPLQLLPKAPSTNHLLAQGRVPVRTVALPRVEVPAPKVAGPNRAMPNPPKPAAPPLDRRHAAAIAEWVARLDELEKQRLELVRNRTDVLAEKTRLERILEQGKKDQAAAEQKVIEYELAIALIDLELDSFRSASGTRDQIIASNQVATLRYPSLSRQRAELVVLQAKQRAEIKKIRVRNESSYKQWLTLPPRIEQTAKQGEFFRRQWLRETCDWYGRRTRHEHEAAAAVFTKAIETDRGNYAARLGRALSYLHLGRSADALVDLSTADDPANPVRAEALALRGYLKVFAGDDARGMIELGQAVTYDRRSLVPLLLRGQAAAHLKRFPGALADFRAAVKLDGTSADARRLLALYYAAAAYNGPRILREAEGAAREAVDLTNQDDWLALLALAAALADAGRFPEAAGQAADAAELTFDTRRERCLELEKLFAAGAPLRLEWSLAGK